jgi:hypothetical protein
VIFFDSADDYFPEAPSNHTNHTNPKNQSSDKWPWWGLKHFQEQCAKNFETQ